MKTLKTFLIVATLLFASNGIAQNEDDKKIMSDAENAKMKILDANSAMQDLFDNSAGYVIFPNVGKGGLIIGAAAGNGVLYEDGVAQGMAKLKKLNIGLQAGGQAIIEVIFFEDETALAKFKDGDFEFDAGVSAVVLESGKAKKAKYKNGVAVIALPKAGLMAEASVGGQKFSYESF
ncbi:lipid-binding SYLF domain-containing protein [Psychroserpens sp. Hel_I_66]|uniref:lipid-binding SYLF domain-containing protein n=1 Tax=Psychroserpens sp. Hel_I_66 TaxID=1250004 RepID=UPI000646DA36|nr:lipid-binding SYLF domain-containing protein [Psychroserpens sp. Hel_I_66]